MELTVILLGLNVIALLYLFKYWRSESDLLAAVIRLLGLGSVSIAIGVFGGLAVGPERILLALGLSIYVREILLYGYKFKGKKVVSYVAEQLPVFVPLFAIAPYGSYFTYFFGLDKAVFILVIASMLSFALLNTKRFIGMKKYLNILLFIISLILSIWVLCFPI